MTRRPLLLGSLAALGAWRLSGCRSKDAKADTKPPKELPPLSFKDGEKNLMLTWIRRPRDDAHRRLRRAHPRVSPRDGARIGLRQRRRLGRSDYLADVSKPETDGGYTARSFPRSAWEDEIHKRRREPSGDEPLPEPKRPRPTPTPSPDGVGPTPTPSAQPSSSAPQKLDPTLNEVNAVVYGAEWCGPCHQALAHLKRRGVKTTFKDIEKDRERAARCARSSRAPTGAPAPSPASTSTGASWWASRPAAHRRRTVQAEARHRALTPANALTR